MKEQSFLFRREVIAALTLFSVLLVGFWVAFSGLRPEDQETYRELMQSADPTHRHALPYTSRQQREGVQKDIMRSKGDQRLEMRLKGTEAHVSMERTTDGVAVVEHLDDVVGWVQESLYNDKETPMQIVQYVEAAHIACNYQRDYYEAEDARLIRVAMPGHQLTGDLEGAQPIVWGTAPHAAFSLKENTITLSGGVIVENDAGQASSETMVLTPQTTGSELRMMGDVTVQQEGIGLLTTDQEAVVTQHFVNGKREIATMTAKGTSILTHGVNNQYVLTSYDRIAVDNTTLTATVTSPSSDLQACFQDTMGEVYGDRFTVIYRLKGGNIVPAKVVLEGNIRILNRLKANDKEAKSLQYVLADRVEYTPGTNAVQMYARDNSRVLFYDQEEEIEISAPGLTIHRDQKLRKDTVKGQGDVRFRFSERELDQFKKHFGL